MSTQNSTPVPAPPVPTQRRGVALAALIFGVAAMVFAIIPGLSFVAFLPALAATILGIVALVSKRDGRGLAVAGLVLGPVAFIVAVIVSVATIVGAVTPDATSSREDRDASTSQADPAPEEEESVSQGTRSNPAPAGSTIEISDTSGPVWEITIGAANFAAGDLIAAENMFNEPAAAGSQYILVPVTYTYVGSLSGTPWIDLNIEYVSAAGTTHTQEFVVIPTPITDIAEMYEGATATGNLVVMAPSDNIEGGTWAVGALFGDKYFVSVK